MSALTLKTVRPPKEAASFAHFLSSVATTLRVHTLQRAATVKAKKNRAFIS
jgi:hypothetical protein